MRWLVGVVLFLLALGTLRTVGCGGDPCGGCDDGEPCTRDWCDTYCKEPVGCECQEYGHTCVHSWLDNGRRCGSGKVCIEGRCRENPCADCVDDGNQCTDYCDYVRRACNVPSPGKECQSESGRDGLCSSDGVCIVCEELDCDDGDLCTTDQCIEGYGCQYKWRGYCDQCARCDPETGECSDALMEGHLCEADDELGISVDWDRSMYGVCESGRCTGQPCDLTSEEEYPCPVEGHPWASVCCPWEHLPNHPRGYCMGAHTCWEARCLTECPSTVAECIRQGGVCPGE